MKRLETHCLPFRIVAAAALLLLASGYLGASCSASSGDKSHVQVVVVHPDTSRALPAGDVFLDEGINIEMTRALDPESVNPWTVRIRRNDTGEAVEGTYIVDGAVIRFEPHRLRPGVRYRVEIPDATAIGESVRDRNGRGLREGYVGKFETRAHEPLVLHETPETAISD